MIIQNIAQAIVAGAFLFYGILFIFKAKKNEGRVKNYIVGIVLFLIFYGISRIPGIFIYSDPTLESDPLINQFRWFMEAGFGTIGMIVLLYVLERYILEGKTRYILTIILVIFLIIALVLRILDFPDIGRIFLYISSAPALAVPIIYLYFGYKTSGETRTRSIGAGIGFIIAYLGIVINTLIIQDVLLIPLFGINGIFIMYILHATFVFVGLTIYYYFIKY